MDKPIDIKRRAQRFVQSGDLDGALAEYQKLAKAEPNEPYHVVVIADLQFRKGDQNEAAKLYFQAVDGYQQSTLYKNAIAVCKKMVRLGLAPATVFRRLGELHVHDGLRTEAGLYFMQHGEMSARREMFVEAEKAYRLAFESSPENVVALERLADLLLTRDDTERWRTTLEEAASAYDKLGQLNEASRCRSRITGSPAPLPAATNGDTHVPAAVVDEVPVVDAPEVETPAPETPAATTPSGEIPLQTFQGRTSIPMDTVLERPEGFEQTSHRVPAAESEPERPGLKSSGDEVIGGTIDLDAALAEEAAASAPPPVVESAPAAAVEPVAPAPEPEAAAVATPESAPAEAAMASAAEVESAAASSKAKTAAAVGDSGGRTRDALLKLLDSCRQRKDQAGAGATACELGDLALMEGDRVGALEWFEKALEYDPGCKQAKDLIARLASTKSSEISEVPMYDLPVLTGEEGLAEGAVEPTISTISEEGKLGVVMKTDRFDLNSLVTSFQEQLKEQFQADPRSHFDLGMTYREMGMYDQAMESFRLAGESPEFMESSSEMVGCCLMDQGRFDEAADTLKHGVERAEQAGLAATSLHYHLGLAYEAAAKLEEALKEFEAVYKKDPSHADVVRKIRVLLKTLGNG